jgi:glycosyltransferase involved in cell wall biosynthesis
VRAIRTGYLRTQDGQDTPRDPELRLFISALAIRLAVLTVIVTFAGVEGLFLPDTKAYLGLAHSLLEGRGFVHEGVAFSYRTIGYPLFLAALLPWMKSLVLIAIVQVCIASTLPQLVQAVGRKLGLSTRVRHTAAWMTVFEPHTVYYSALIMTEWIFPVLTLLALLTALRAVRTRRLRHAAIAGVWFGIGLLVKPLWMAVPVLVFLGAAVGRVFNVWRPSWRACAVWAVVVGVIVSPWLVRNYLTFGTWNLSSQGPSAAVFYLGSSIVSVAERVSYQEAEERLRRMFEERTGLSRYEDGHDRSLVYTAFAKELIQTYPGAFARVIVGSTISFWTSHNYAYIPHYYHLTPPIDKSVLPPTHYLVQGRYGDFVSGFVKIFGQPFYFLGAVGRGIWLVIGLFMLYGLFATLKRSPKEPGHWIVLALFLALTATVWVNGLGVEGRLRLPVMPLQWLYAAAGIAALVRARRRREPGQLPALLIMTQRVDEDDRNLAVHLRWIRMFVSMGIRVTVIAQSVGRHGLPEQVKVFSLGKEAGASKGSQLLRLVRLAWPALKKADRALVLMSPIYVLLLAPLAVLRDCPLYLWYTHKHVSRTLRAAVSCVRLVFSASPESFRLKTPKVRFLGHAIDTDFFVPAGLPRDPLDLVTVGRLSRAKRIEHMIEAVKLLRRDGRDYRLTVIGEPIMEEDHASIAKLKHRVEQEGLDGWVMFLGGRSPEDVRRAYQRAGACLNASQTGSLDKALLEAMACGCPVVTTNEAFRLIAPEGFVGADSAEAMARALDRVLAHPLDAATLRERVTAGHDMQKTLGKMLELMQRHP